MEEFLGNEALFLEEPTEDQAGEEADEAGGAAFLVVGFEVGGELDLRERPEIPVGEFLVEAGVEEIGIEDGFQGCVEGFEAVDLVATLAFA